MILSTFKTFVRYFIVERKLNTNGKAQGGNSQNFLSRILKIFVTLGLKILILSRLKEVFEREILKCWC